jgi:signal transduction histidine kinase
MLSACTILGVVCLWLLGRLAIYSQAQQVIKLERARIARDIHDDLSAGLTQLVLFGEVSQRDLPEGSEARRQIARVCEKARGLSQAMNEIIWMVNSRRDTFRDFTSYVCKYAETFLQATPIRCRFEVEEDIPDLPCDLGVRRNLFLGVKEALNNVARHSGAGEVLLRVRQREQEMVVNIEDNGNGFDPTTASGRGNGLLNMAMRAVEAGGVCLIASRPGAGCQIEFVVPLARAVKSRWKFWRRRSYGEWGMAPTDAVKPSERARTVAGGKTDSASLSPDAARANMPPRR